MSIPLKVVGFLCANIVLQFLAVVAVLLRFIIRKRARQPLGSDDWTILVALAISLGLFASYVYGVLSGAIGVSWIGISPSTYVNFRKVTFAVIIICHFVYGLIKISVMLFYKRIFTINRRFRYAVNAILVAISIFIILSFFMMLFAAQGVSTFWTTPPALEGTEYVSGLGPPTLPTAFAVTDVFLDLCVLSLPIPVIFNLNLSVQKKIAVSAVFLLGGFCLICSVVRLYYTHALEGFNDESVEERQRISELNDLWAHIEAYASILTACLPTLRPLFTDSGGNIQRIIAKVRSVFSIRSTSSESRSGPWYPYLDHHILPLGQGNWNEMNAMTTAQVLPGKHQDTLDEQRQSTEAIMVKKTFDLQHT